MSDEETVLPCRKCGSTDISIWDGTGTQAEMQCNLCGMDEGLQVVDLLVGQDRFGPMRNFSMVTMRYPDKLVEMAQQELIREWNKRFLG